jgi:hypothetical protein
MVHFDLANSDTFSALAPESLGIVNITYRMVSCDVGSDNIKLKIKGDSTNSWASFLVLRHRTQLVKFEVQESGSSSWRTITRQPYNQFEVSPTSGSFRLPMNIRLTSVTGATVTKSLTAITAGATIDTGGQFPEVSAGYGGSSIKCCSAQDQSVLFDDLVRDPWADWSNAATSIVTTQKHSGSSSIRVQFAQWQLLQLGSNLGVPLSEVAGISFWAKAGTATTASFTVVLKSGGAGQTISIPTTWTKFDFQISQFATTNPLKLFAIQSNQAAEIFVDDVVWTKAGASTAKCADGVVHNDDKSSDGGQPSSSSSSSSLLPSPPSPSPPPPPSSSHTPDPVSSLVRSDSSRGTGSEPSTSSASGKKPPVKSDSGGHSQGSVSLSDSTSTSALFVAIVVVLAVM